MSAEMSDFKRCMFPAKEVVLEDGMRGPCGVSMAMWSWKLGCVVHVGSAWPCGRGRLSAACDPPPPLPTLAMACFLRAQSVRQLITSVVITRMLCCRRRPSGRCVSSGPACCLSVATRLDRRSLHHINYRGDAHLLMKLLVA